MPSPACNRYAVDLPATATRRVQLALVLAAGGSMVLMAGFSIVVIGEATALQHPGRAGGLITLGLVLAVIGLALGLACAGVTMASTQVRASPVAAVPVTAAQVTAMRAGTAGETAGHQTTGLGTAAHETTVPAMTASGTELPAAALRRMAQTGPEVPGTQSAGARHVPEPGADAYLQAAAWPEFPAQYSDAGWQLEGPDLAPAGQLPAGPPPEIHHPVRSQHPAHTTGQFPAYQTGQFPAYRDPQPGDPGTGPLPAYQAEYATGQQPCRPDQP
jgi:hypothetical protein